MTEEPPIEVEELGQDEKPLHRIKKRWTKLSMMSKATIVIVIILIVAAASLSAPGNSIFKEKYHLIPFDAQRAYQDHQWYQNLGARMAGTDAEEKGAEYMASQMAAAGLKNVHIEVYDIFLFEVKTAEVSIVPYGPTGSIPKPLSSPTSFKDKSDFVVQGFSGSHPWSSFKDDLTIYDMGNGTTNASWKNAGGKCGLLHTDQWTLSDTLLFRKAMEYHLSCLALHNKAIHAEIGYVPIFKGVYLGPDESYAEIPFFMMSKVMGDQVTGAAQNGSKMRLNFDIPKSKNPVRVIIGDVPGRERSDKYVMLGAHSDTVYNGPGQVDNTAGTVTVLEMARNMAKERPKVTIRFAGFGGEEEGLLGSNAYVQAHSQDIKDNMIFYQNCDMTNIDLLRGTGGWIGTNDNATADHYKAIDYLAKQKDPRFEKYGMSFSVGGMNSGSDQASFLALDKKVSFGAGSGSSEYHTYLDDINHINTESEALFGEIMGTYAYYLAENA